MGSAAFNFVQRAARHPIRRESPAVNFFEGAVLGNGGLGAVVCTRPDAVLIHFGHNNVWDIRLYEEQKEKIGTFQDVFQRVKAVSAQTLSLDDDEWFKNYFALTTASYRKPYPRPFPCGTLLLGFDRRHAEILGHHLDISTGLCRVQFLIAGESADLHIFVDMRADCLWLRMVDALGKPMAGPFNRVRLLPDPQTPKDMPAYTVPDNSGGNALCFRHVLPYQEPESYDLERGHPQDRAVRLTVRVNVDLESQIRTDTWSGLPEPMGALERGINPQAKLLACVRLDEGLAAVVPNAVAQCSEPTLPNWEAARRSSTEIWHDYWGKSGVALEDDFLEQIWYSNLYFFNCAVKPGVTCPGLWANWSYGTIGSEWHGDYHMNYNTQQPFWVSFSSNHVEKNLPYVELVERVLPLERQWAREYYGLRGAYGMHSLYPVEMTTNPYPVPAWGWEICETPWTMQGLWWHYLYTQDRDFLKNRAFGPIRDAVLFLVDYMKRPEARGPQWGDDKYHIFPTVPPELYGLRPGFKNNHDCLVDLTLTKFIFHAYLRACDVLACAPVERALMDEVREILAHFPNYPTADSPAGRVFVSVPGENPEIVQNTPNSLMTVFPGEDHGLHSAPEDFTIAANSLRQHRNEGGNELVFLNLQAARLGLLDLEKFKRQIAYCLLPNGTCTDKCLQSQGRYADHTDFAFMAPMGIWFENFALPVVINECLLQSYNGVLRLFPNWPKDKRAEFRTLRAVGAFLVSAAIVDGEVLWIEIYSQAGAPLKLLLPWPQAVLHSSVKAKQAVIGPVAEMDTSVGEVLRLVPGLLHPAVA